MFCSCEGEALLDDYKDMYRYATIPNAVRPLLASLLRLLGQPRASKIVQAAGKKSAYQYWQCVCRAMFAVCVHVCVVLCVGVGLVLVVCV